MFYLISELLWRFRPCSRGGCAEEVGQVAEQVAAGGLTTRDTHEEFQRPEGTTSKRVAENDADDLYFQSKGGCRILWDRSLFAAGSSILATGFHWLLLILPL